MMCNSGTNPFLVNLFFYYNSFGPITDKKGILIMDDKCGQTPVIKHSLVITLVIRTQHINIL